MGQRPFQRDGRNEGTADGSQENRPSASVSPETAGFTSLTRQCKSHMPVCRANPDRPSRYRNLIGGCKSSSCDTGTDFHKAGPETFLAFPRDRGGGLRRARGAPRLCLSKKGLRQRTETSPSGFGITRRMVLGDEGGREMKEGHSHHLPSQRGLKNQTTANTKLIAAPSPPADCGVSLTSDTVIPTPDGWTTLADISPRDSVFDEQGRICIVTDVSAETLNLVYRVTFSDSSDIVTGADHPWMTLTHMDLCPVGRSMFRSGPWHAGCWPVTTRELELLFNRPIEMRTVKRHYIPVAGVLDLPERDLPVDPWLLGLWLGDGNSKSALVTCSPMDEPHYRERIRKIGENWRVLKPENPVFVCSLAWGPNPRLLTRLRNMNLVNNKHLPDLYLRASQGQRLALLQGLMDSDGHVYPHGRAEFTSKSLRLADGVRELAISLGMKATVKESKARQGGRNVAEHLRVRFAPTISVVTLPRKTDVGNTFMARRPKGAIPRTARRSIRSVTLVGLRATRCISVDSPLGMVLVGRQMLPLLSGRGSRP